MNATELAEQVAEAYGLSNTQAKRLVEAVFTTIAEAGRRGEEVSVPGFGKFKVASRPARQGRNPATGDTIQIAASKKLAFAPAKQLRDALNAAAPATATKDR